MPDAPQSAVPDKLRVDKWLRQARFCKSRAIAAELAGSGQLRLNREHVLKASQTVRPGDVLTFPLGRRIRVIRIEALGHRRGPAAEAQALYTDLDPQPKSAPPAPQVAEREPGAGRPTKKERRATDALREGGE